MERFMTAMERSISPYDVRGSEVTMEDSLRLKQRKENAGFSDLGVQYAPSTESGTANGEISESGVQRALSTDSGNTGWWKELRVQETSDDSGVMVNGKRFLLRSALGIVAGASLDDNIAGFQPMTRETGKFSCPEAVAWLTLVSSVSKCPGMALRAAEYAQRIVVDDGLDEGRYWFEEPKEYWLSFMKEEDYEALEQFGFDYEAQMQRVQMELDLCELQKEVDDMRAGAETLEALKQGQYQYAEHDGTLEALKHGAGGHELQKRVDEMRELQKRLDDLRAGDKTLEALSLSQYELQQMANDMREMCAAGSGGGVGILEEQMNTLQKIGDEMRAGDTLEALKQGILNRKQIIGEGTMVLHDYEVCAGGKIIKVHTVEIEQDPEVEGGKEDIMISEKIIAEQKSVAKGLIDPGGGANTYMYAGEGKILYPEFTGTWRRNNPGEGQSALAGGEHNEQVRGGKIKDPGKGGNIDHEVQELKHPRSIKEEVEETRNEPQMNKGYRKMFKEEIQMEMDLRDPDGTGPKGDPGGTGPKEKENKKEPKEKKWAEHEAVSEEKQVANDMDNYEMCGEISVA
jgi:hypothetical protein